jgi:hypothetical protein
MTRRVYYWDSGKQKMIEGYPPQRNVKYGEAPFVITDTIDPYFHPAVNRWVESKRGIDEIDRACGTITTDKEILPDERVIKERKRQERKDLASACEEAIARLDNGTHTVPEDVRAMCDIQNRVIAEGTGWDCYNLTGRKNDKRGYKYRGRNRGNVK